MATTYAADYEETFTVPIPPDAAQRHFSDVDVIGRNYGPVDEWEKIDELTVRVKLVPQEHKGLTFRGEYTARYTHAPGALRWDTLSQGNMRSRGTATFKAKGSGTEVHYSQHIEVDVEVGKLLGKVVGPFITLGVRDGVKTYLARMRAAV